MLKLVWDSLLVAPHGRVGRLPLPQPAHGRQWQPVARLAGDHDDLTAVMSRMRYEIGQHVADVEGQVAPDIPPRRRDLTPGLKAQFQQRCDGVAAVLQGSHELPPCDTTLIHASRCGNAVLPPQRLDPAASRVVQMSCDHSDRAPWRSGTRGVPECGWQAL